ncbi:phosphatase domain-containing protein, partial [Salmonella enterica subsp. enterica serovar Minnesota]|uniref:phosphatase domain-containing protein n=1 Tax=Salmonella enterica TaxID=28901 RepID=UPI003D2C9D22
VFVVDPDVRSGIVSDVDDTVMVTALPRPFLAAWNSFVVDEHARQPVPGMAVLLERLTRDNPGAPVVYLSTGAWNVAPTLVRFMRRQL